MTMSKVINVDEFKVHMGNLADKAASTGDAGSVIAYRMLIEILDIYADIYGEDVEDA